MNIKLIATVLSQTNIIDKMQLIKIRGCNRNENCVYFDDDHFLVYEINTTTKNTKNNKDNFINDLINLFQTHFSKSDAIKIYDFIKNNHLKVSAANEKPVDEYAKTDAEKIALTVLRKDPYCDKEKFRELAFDYAIDKNYSRNALSEAITLFSQS